MARADPRLTDAEVTRSPARLATGIKMFVILLLALLPLGLIALIAALQSNRVVDVERRALLRVAATESARTLSVEMVGDMAALRTAANALAANPGDAATCAQIGTILAVQSGSRIRFGIGRTGQPSFCGHNVPPLYPPGTQRASNSAARIIAGRGLLLGVRSDDGTIAARAFFPVALLAELGRPTNFMPGYSLSLTDASGRLPLQEGADASLVKRMDRLAVPIGVEGLGVDMSLARAALTAPEIVSIVAPLLMWLAAALIAWLVTDRLLLAPLRRLRGQLSMYQPGETFTPPPDDRTPAVELRELGETFRRITTIVAEHEAGLARGLEHQTRLTREVHHRVKNNLQVIASLISLHARGAKGTEAVRAYSSIQRRVDALSVVHRNHFAEQEVNRGLNLRSVLGELASNIRATALADSAGMRIALELDPLYVTQDTAVAVAFLVTELIELAMEVAPATLVAISLSATDMPGRALLAVQSQALAKGTRLDKLRQGSVARVIEGLGRQLRAPLAHDPDLGRYAIEIGFVARD